MIRHRLITVGGAPAVPTLDVGFDFTSATPTGTLNGWFTWSNANPLNATGTITTVTVNVGSAGIDIAFALISPPPSNTVRSISTTVVSSSGVNSYAVNLAGEAGDYIALWASNSLIGTATTAATGVTTWRNTTTSSKPSPGDTRGVSLISSNLAVWIYGTG